MAKRRPKMTLSKKPQARTGDFEQLFTTAADTERSAGMQLVSLRLDKISPDPLQPRTEFNDETIADLAASISSEGLIQPIEVVQVEKDTYRIIHGERRWRAAQKAGWESIPAIVQRRDYDDITRFVRQMIENIQREDLNDIDRAAGLVRLRELMQEEFNAAAEKDGSKPWSTKATMAKVAERLGYTRQRVSQLTKLLQLPPEVQDSVKNGTLSERDTRVFHKLNARQQRGLHRARVIDGTLSQAEMKRAADFIRRNETQSVKVAIAAVHAGDDKLKKPSKTVRREKRQRQVKQLQSAIETFELDGMDSAESKQVLDELSTIQKKLQLLIKSLKSA